MFPSEVVKKFDTAFSRHLHSSLCRCSLLAAACGTAMEPASPKASQSTALSSSSDAGTQYGFQLFDAPEAGTASGRHVSNRN